MENQGRKSEEGTKGGVNKASRKLEGVVKRARILATYSVSDRGARGSDHRGIHVSDPTFCGLLSTAFG